MQNSSGRGSGRDKSIYDYEESSNAHDHFEFMMHYDENVQESMLPNIIDHLWILRYHIVASLYSEKGIYAYCFLSIHLQQVVVTYHISLCDFPWLES